MSTLDQVLADLKSENNRMENQLKQLRSAIAALQGISSNSRQRRNGNGHTISASASNGTRRTMSASARRRIAAAQKARWAKWKKHQSRLQSRA